MKGNRETFFFGSVGFFVIESTREMQKCYKVIYFVHTGLLSVQTVNRTGIIYTKHNVVQAGILRARYSSR